MQYDIACMIDPSIYVSIIFFLSNLSISFRVTKNKSNLSNTLGGGKKKPTWGFMIQFDE